MQSEQSNTTEQIYYKAFDYDAKTKTVSCNGTEFSLTESNILRKKDGTINRSELIYCSNGFHYGSSIQEILKYYFIHFESIEKYAIGIIEPKDSLKKQEDKYICREFKITKLFVGKEIEELLYEEYFKPILKCYNVLR